MPTLQERALKPALLVVDDELDLLQLMQASLTAKGYDVKISPNGADLLDTINLKRPDVVVLDLQMDGIDGGTICQLIKHNQSTANIPVVIVSANDNIQLISADCGANACLKKPFNANTFDEMLQQILSSKQQ